jgi:outer membrane protein assembly factor BamB
MADNALPSPAAPPDSPRELAAIFSLLLLFAVGVLIVWLPTTPPAPLPVEKYAPLPSGASYVYRITYPDGAVTYRYRNVSRANGLVIGTNTNVNVFTALYDASGFQGAADDSTGLAAALRGMPAARVADVEVNAAGVMTPTTTILLLGENSLSVVGVDEVGVQPPLPILTDQPTVTVSGLLNETVPYSSSLSIDQPQALETPLGELKDCLTTRQSLTVNETYSRALTWFCALIGETRDDRFEGEAERLTRSELIAVSVNEVTRGIAPNLPVSALGSVPEFQFVDPIPLPVTERWTHAERYNNAITSSILPLGDLLLYGTQGGALVAYNRAADREEWRFQTGGPIFGVPVAQGGIVYFGSGDKKLYAVNAVTGGFLWAFAAQDVITGSPAISENTLYFGSEDRNVYALGALNGALRWKTSTGGPVAATPVIADGLVYIGSDDGALYALNAISGSPEWVFKTGAAVTGRAVPGEGVVYVTSYDQHVYALEVHPESRTGAELWKYDAQDYVPFGPTVADGRVFVVTPDQVRAVDSRGGAPLWRYESDNGLAGPVVVTGNQVWVTRKNDIQALDAATGRVLAATPHNDFLADAGLSSDGKFIYSGDLNGVVREFGGPP